MASFTFVYVLREVGFDPASSRSKLPRTYVGWSTDVAARLATHNSGKGAKTTRGRQWDLVYVERFRTFGQAMSREWHLKRDRKLRKMLAGG
ncbi:MAG: excinuclease ABC subunit C [Thalassospira sp.]|uniref:Excinuclease ABC subunit C n=3 Tax=Thalassospira TaxID=168934 RepID=A0A2N3L234_9PROT|nr:MULTISPECIES: GIY-YIG nuclease family protein [Thalassospira]MBV17791.1 excinuclease ABC subunit C [Thalassospira sp.]PKR56865.1 excinuclease ABC subunit C [Thalassospira lohafexi]|tara:strand:- start:34205 stop:34477 length:273 start_codon:yes stop_codon:yes gene_type:complete